VKADVSSTFVDDQGRQMSGLRMEERGDTAAALEVSPNGSGVFPFELVVDQLDRRAHGTITFSAPGLAPVHVPVLIEPRRPLLGKSARAGLYMLGASAGLFAVVAAVGWLWHRRCQPGRAFTLQPGQSLFGRLAFRPAERGDGSLTALQRLRYGFQHAGRRATAVENQRLPVSLAEVTPRNPLLIEEGQPEGEDRWLLVLHDYHDSPPELHGEILEAPAETRLARKRFRQTVGRLCLATAGVALATTLFWHPVLVACQWFLDLVTF
jgi:hypothetical protein